MAFSLSGAGEGFACPVDARIGMNSHPQPADLAGVNLGDIVIGDGFNFGDLHELLSLLPGPFHEEMRFLCGLLAPSRLNLLSVRPFGARLTPILST